jgi:hydrogenase nickel incorporation protein HypA/HybF
MHEYVYADRVLQTVLEASSAAKKSPKLVMVEAGELLGLSQESLQLAYEVLSKGTRAEGSKVEVTFFQGKVECPACGYSGGLPHKGHTHNVDPVFACPECGMPVKVSGGLDLKLLEIRWEGSRDET